MRTVISLLIFWAAILGTGCQPISTGTEKPVEVTPSQMAVTSGPFQGVTQMSPTPTTGTGLQELIDKTREDLAGRLAIPLEQVALVETIEAEWSDSSLDCPQSGMSYLQVITPGYRVILQAGGQTYEYHANRDSYFVFCEDQVPPILPKP